MQANIKAIEYYLPEKVLANSELAAQFSDWSAEKIRQKTGIAQRHIANDGECSSDLAAQAANRLFATGVCSPPDIDYVLLCTQTPDYFLPTTACLVQARLGIPQTAGALDFNLGCSGYIYGLSLAKGLIETGQARNVLLLTAETYSKLIHPLDRSVRTIFGDGAAATLVVGQETPEAGIGPFVLGTDGAGAKNLIVPRGGMRERSLSGAAEAKSDDYGNQRSADNLFMDGAEIFTFTLRVVPKMVQDLLLRAGKTASEIDLFVFHQANEYMLEHLRKKMKIPHEKFVVSMEDCGNTVSATIPIALQRAVQQGRIRSGHTLMLVGFGVGYSWGATLVKWR